MNKFLEPLKLQNGSFRTATLGAVKGTEIFVELAVNLVKYSLNFALLESVDFLNLGDCYSVLE